MGGRGEGHEDGREWENAGGRSFHGAERGAKGEIEERVGVGRDRTVQGANSSKIISVPTLSTPPP